MRRFSSPIAAFLSLVAPAGLACAQAPIGLVEASAATVSGMLSLNDGKALVGGNSVITAHDRTADLQLSRGGEILVCATSALHAARSPGPNEPAPLLLALDRGAIEVHMLSTSRDTILTPDLRFSIAAPGPGLQGAGLLDLRLRVTQNGDTCVENRGTKAPTLEVGELFGNGLYVIRPGQHLLFEHGSLREVVDQERSPCGCPAPPALSVASNGISTDVTRAAVPKARVADDPEEVRPHTEAAAQYPFPAAESQGLTPSSNVPPPQPASTPGEPRTQVAATLSFNPGTASPSINTGLPVNGGGTAGLPAGTASANAARPSGTASGTASAGPAGRAGSTAGATTSPQVASSGTNGPVPQATAQQRPPVQTAAAAPPPVPQPTPAREPIGTAAPSPNTDRYESHEVAQAPLPPAAPSAHDLAHSVSHFFRHLFGFGDKRAAHTTSSQTTAAS